MFDCDVLSTGVCNPLDTPMSMSRELELYNPVDDPLACETLPSTKRDPLDLILLLGEIGTGGAFSKSAANESPLKVCLDEWVKPSREEE